jgi:arsenite methyltransferase
MSTPEQIKQAVRDHYARAARLQSACGCETSEDLAGASGPSLGCGSPLSYADLKPGEVGVDLGSGAGLDVLRAAQRVGPQGEVVGVDMTPEMVALAGSNAATLGVPNARFLLGELESLPLADGFADVVVSNCVINLVPDKRRAFREAYRVLKPGGRLVVSDVVAARPLPPEAGGDLATWSACVAGALPLDEYLEGLQEAGFEAVEVVASEDSCCELALPVRSVTIRARRPARPSLLQSP